MWAIWILGGASALVAWLLVPQQIDIDLQKRTKR